MSVSPSSFPLTLFYIVLKSVKACKINGYGNSIPPRSLWNRLNFLQILVATIPDILNFLLRISGTHVKLCADLRTAVHLNTLDFITFTILVTVIQSYFCTSFVKKTTFSSPLGAILKEAREGTSCSTGCFHCVECTLGSICVATVATKFKVVSITKIQRRCCRRDRNFSISATLVAAVAVECVSIHRYRQ